MVQVIQCSRIGIHVWVRAFQCVSLMLILIFLSALSSSLDKYRAGDSKMLFHNTKIIVGGLKQLCLGMLIGLSILLMINALWSYSIALSENKRKEEEETEEDKKVRELREKVGFGSFCITLFLTITILVVGHAILFASSMALFNQISRDQNEYQNIASIEEKNSTKDQIQKENAFVSFSLLFALMNLGSEIIRILIEIYFYMESWNISIFCCACCKDKKKNRGDRKEGKEILQNDSINEEQVNLASRPVNNIQGENPSSGEATPLSNRRRAENIGNMNNQQPEI